MSFYKSADGHRTFYQNKTKSTTFLATEDFATLGVSYISCRNANYTLYIQKIVVNVSTVAAQTLTFQDTAGTPVVIGILPTSAARGAQTVLDAGTIGIPLTQGKSLSIIASAAGIAGNLVIEGYLKLTAALDAGSGSTNQ